MAITGHRVLEAYWSERACPRIVSQLLVNAEHSTQTHDSGPGSSQPCLLDFVLYQYMLLSRMFLGLVYKSPLDSRSQLHQISSDKSEQCMR